MRSNYKLTYANDAIADVREASSWYNLQQKGLGKKFRNDVSVIVQTIEKNPFFSSVKYANIRTASCKNFP